MSAGSVLVPHGHPPLPDGRRRTRIRLSHRYAVPASAPAPVPQQERRSPDRVTGLGRAHDVLVTTAMHPWDIAAGLEAAGMTDAGARAHYGHPDVFGLADELFARVPRRFSPPASTEDTRRARRVAMLRGLLYAVPILFALAVAPLVGDGGQTLLLASLVAAWSWTQAMTSLGHRRLGLGDLAGARRMLGGTALVGALLWGGAAALSLASGTSAAAVAVSSAQVVYFLASGIVVVLGGEVALLVVLLPGAAAASAYVVVPGEVSAPVISAAMLLSVTGSVGLAGTLVLRSRSAARPTWRELQGSLPYAVHGAALALLLVAGLQVRPESGAAQLADTAALPVVFAMAAGEELLRRYRTRIRALLEVVTRPEEFRPLARRALAGVLGGFLLLITLATVVLQLLQHLLTEVPSSHLLFGVAYAALGAGMFGAVLLSALGEVRAAAFVSVPSAVVLWAVLLTSPDGPGPGPITAYAVTCAVLLVGTTSVALGRVGQVWVHR